MKKYMLGIGVLLGFSFAALAGNQVVTKTIPVGDGKANGVSICDAVAGNLVVNCGLETSPTCLVTFAGCPESFLPEWTPSGDLSWTGVFAGAPVAYSGANGAFSGPVDDLGFITQTLATTAGSTYSLTFWLQGGPGAMNYFQVLWDGALVFELVNEPAFAYMPVTLDGLVASVDGTDLAFGFYQPPNFWFLDDVIVAEVIAK